MTDDQLARLADALDETAEGVGDCVAAIERVRLIRGSALTNLRHHAGFLEGLALGIRAQLPDQAPVPARAETSQ